MKITKTMTHKDKVKKVKKIKFSKIEIYKNGKKLSEIKIGVNLVCSADISYARGKGQDDNDMFICSGFLDKNKKHHVVDVPFDEKLIPGDEILIKIV